MTTKEKVRKAIEEHLTAGGLVTNPDMLVERIDAALRHRATRFPLEYKGWRIEIKMGHEMGCRGSVANRRGYSATRIEDGKTVQFKPQYEGAASLCGVKAMIDTEERAKEIYSK